MSVIFIAGVWLVKEYLKDRLNKYIRFKRNRYRELKEYFTDQLNDSDLNAAFYNAGLNIKAIHYQLIRYSLFMVYMLLLAVEYINAGYVDNRNLILAFAVFGISSPTMTFMGKTTPFNYIMLKLSKYHKERLDIEISRSITHLKNIAIAQKDKPMGADFIISQLMRFTVLTKPIYSNMLFIF